MSEPSDHYSYAVYADPAMAAGFDARRFGGPIGRLIFEDQERALLEFLGDVKDRDALDVGTGTGRAALALARCGARITGVDASSEMLRIARTRAAGAGLQATFLQADAHALTFPDRSFEVAVCFRLLMHAPDWKQCLSEICRVTRRRVVLDYPALASAAALQGLWRQTAQTLGRSVEAYRVLADATVARELARHGFRVVAVHRQFVLPIALHKLVGSVRMTRAVEGAFAAVGLLRLAGSPVTVAAERCES